MFCFANLIRLKAAGSHVSQLPSASTIPRIVQDLQRCSMMFTSPEIL